MAVGAMSLPLRAVLVCVLVAVAAAQREAQISSRMVTFWGRDACPDDEATLLYNGTAHHSSITEGSISNILCVPLVEPADTFGLDLTVGVDSVAASVRPSIYHNGGRTAITDFEAFHLSGIYCAVCNYPNHETWINWGATDCPARYEPVDAGYMVTTHYTHSRRQAICITEDAPTGPSTPTQDSTQFLYMAEYSDSRSIGGYTDDLEVRCAVCKAPEHYANSGSIFAHWGALTCPDGSISVSPGRQMMGNFYTSSGSSPEYYCMAPEASTEGTQAGQQTTAALHPVEYQTAGLIVTTDVHDFDAPCSICRSNNIYSTYMPGRPDCVSDKWKSEYTGILMAERYSHYPTTPVCVPLVPDVFLGTSANQNGALLYPVLQKEFEVTLDYGYSAHSISTCSHCTSDAGPSFVYWGKQTCPGDLTTVYSGVVFGSDYRHPGSSSEWFCMPPDPDESLPTDGVNFAHIYEAQFLMEVGPYFPYRLKTPSCALCQDETTEVAQIETFQGMLTCPSGWDVVYRGFSMASRGTHAPTFQICMDRLVELARTADTVTHSKDFDAFLYQSEYLNAQPFADETDLPCVVCQRPVSDGHCGNGIVEQGEFCDDGNYDETDLCAGCQIPRPDIELSECLTDNVTRSVLSEFTDAAEDCVILAVSDEDVSVQTILDNYASGATCESICSPAPGSSVCPGACAFRPACDAELFPTSIWYMCPMPKSCAVGAAGETEKKTAMLLAIPRFECATINSLGASAVLAVTFAEEAAPFSGCASSAAVDALDAGPPGSPARSCRGIGYHRGYSRTVDEMVRQGLPGKRCVAAQSTVYGALDAAPSAAGNVTRCDAEIADGDWWLCDKPQDLQVGDGREEAWLVVVPATADGSGCSADAALLVDVTVDDLPPVLDGLKRVERPYVRVYVETTTLTGIAYPGWYAHLRTDSAIYDPVFASDLHADDIDYLDIPEGLFVYTEHTCCNEPGSSSYSIFYGPIYGPFSATLDSSLGANVQDMIVVGVAPGYYADVWRGDFEELSALHKDWLLGVTSGSIITIINNALGDGTGYLEYANTYGTCAELRENVEWFFPEDGVAEVAESVHPRLFDGNRYTSELTNISPVTEDDENFSLLASTNDRASSATAPLGVRMKGYTSSNYGGTEYEFDSNVYPFLHLMSPNTYSSVRVGEAPWCTDRRRRNACGVVASDKNVMVGEVVYDDRCRPPIHASGSVQRCTAVGGLDIAGCTLALDGDTLAAAVEAAVGEACATAGPTTPSAETDGVPRATRWSEACADISVDRSVYDYYVCEHASGHEAVLVEAPKGQCDAVTQRRLWFAGSAPCSGSDAECSDLNVGSAFQVHRNSSFVHWGQSDCPAGSSLVYSGIGGGTKTQDELGGSAEPLCLNSASGMPTDLWAIFADAVVRSDFIENNDDLALVYAMEYSFLSGQTAVSELLAVHGFEVPCAVCSVEQQTAWTQFGSDQCPGGQTTLAPGYTVATSWQQTRGEFLCMSQTPEGIGSSDTSEDRNWNTVPVEVQLAGIFGSYTEAQEANCAICASAPGETGAVYVDYGRGSCSGDATPLVENGLVVGSHSLTSGGGTGYLCLVPDASTTNVDGVQRGTAILPSHFESLTGGPAAMSDLDGFPMTCSVCQAAPSAASVTMVPGTMMCPGGLEAVSGGYLVSQSSGEPTMADLVCLDIASEPFGDAPVAGEAVPLYPTSTVYGAGEHLGYAPGKPLACAMCQGTSAAPSPTFVHWGGQNRCPGGPDDVVYSGLAMGSEPGVGSVRLLCMPDNPAYFDEDATGGVAPSTGDLGGKLQPAWHYTEDSSIIANRDTVSHAVGCTVCQPHATRRRVVSSVEVLPGTVECPAGAELEYVGRMFTRASSTTAAGKSDFVCMANRPDQPDLGVLADQFETPLVLRESEFRGSVDAAYPDGHEVACSVCSWAAPKLCDGADLGGVYDQSSCVYVGELAGKTLADITAWASGDDNGGRCAWQGVVQTGTDMCPAPGAQTPCADATLEAGRDAYLCEAPTACEQGQHSYHLVEAPRGTCEAVQASVLTWEAAVPEVGLALPTCGAVELGGAVETGSCRAIGRTEAGVDESLNAFLWRTTGSGCDVEGPRMEDASVVCGGVATNVTCGAAGVDGAFDWFECRVAADADAACGAQVLVRTAVGTCDVVSSSVVTGRGADARIEACDGGDFGGVLASVSCEFVGQSSAVGAPWVIDDCGLVGTPVAHSDACPVDAVGAAATPCENVAVPAPLDNYVCSYPSGCALNDGGSDTVWVRAEPGTCSLVDMREVVPSEASSYVWAHIELENGTAIGTEFTLRDGETDAVLAQTTVFEELSAGAIAQVPLFQIEESALDGAELSMSASGGLPSGQFVPGSVVLFGAPGYSSGGALTATGECLEVAVAGTSAATGSAVFSGNLTTSDDGFLGDLDGCGSGAASVYKRVFLWEAPSPGLATISVSATGFDPVVAVYEPSQCERAACSDDFGALGNDGVEVPAGTGALYLIAVAGASVGESGAFTVDISIGAPSLAGECAAALVTDNNLVSRQGSAVVTGTVAGSDTVFASYGCSTTGAQRGWLWYAPASGTLTVTVSAVFDVGVEIRTASTCSAEACATGDFDSAAEATASVVGGEWYAIGVTSSAAGTGGIFTLGISFSGARRRRAGSVDGGVIADLGQRLGSDSFVVDLGAGNSTATGSCSGPWAGKTLVVTAPFAGRFQMSTEDSSEASFIALVDLQTGAELGCSVGVEGPAIIEATLEARASVTLVVGGAQGQTSGLVRINMMAVFDGAHGFVNSGSTEIAAVGVDVDMSPVELSLSRVLVRRSRDFGRIEFSTEALAGFAVSRASLPDGLFLFRSCRPIALAGGEAALFFSAVPTNMTFFADDLLTVRLEHDAATDAFPAQFASIEVYPPSDGAAPLVLAPYSVSGDELGETRAVTYVREGTSIYVTLRFASDPLPLDPVSGFLRLWIDDGSVDDVVEALVPLQLLTGEVSARIRAVATRTFSRAASLRASFESTGGVLPLVAVIVEAWTGLESAFEFGDGAFSQPGAVVASSGFSLAVPTAAVGGIVTVRSPGSESGPLTVDSNGDVAVPGWVYPVFVVSDANGAALVSFNSSDVLGTEHAFETEAVGDGDLFWSVRTDLVASSMLMDVSRGVDDAVPVSVQVHRWAGGAFVPYKHGLLLSGSLGETREPEPQTVLFESDYAGVGALGGGVQVWNRQVQQLEVASIQAGETSFVPSLGASDPCVRFGSTFLAAEQSALFVPRGEQDVEVTVRLSEARPGPTRPTVAIGVAVEGAAPGVARLLATSTSLAGRECNADGASIAVRTFVAPEAGLPPLVLTLAATGPAEARLVALVDVLDSFGIEREYSFANETASPFVTLLAGRNVSLASDPTATEDALAVGARPGYPHFPPVIEIVASGLTPSRPFLLAVGSREIATFVGCNSQVRQAAEVLNEACTDLTEAIDIESYAVQIADAEGLWRGTANVTVGQDGSQADIVPVYVQIFDTDACVGSAPFAGAFTGV